MRHRMPGAASRWQGVTTLSYPVSNPAHNNRLIYHVGWETHPKKPGLPTVWQIRRPEQLAPQAKNTRHKHVYNTSMYLSNQHHCKLSIKYCPGQLRWGLNPQEPPGTTTITKGAGAAIQKEVVRSTTTLSKPCRISQLAPEVKMHQGIKLPASMCG